MDATRRVLKPGWVAIREGRIDALGAGATPAEVRAERTIDARGGVVHPGFIDSHAHVGWGVGRCFVPEHFSDDEAFWKFDVPMLATATDREEHLGAKLASLEMALNGTTCFADTGSALHDLAPSVEGVEEVGIRGMVSYVQADSLEGVPILNLSLEQCVERMEDGLARYPVTRGRAWACPGLVGMETASDELVLAASDLAERSGVPVNIHKCFSHEEVDDCRVRMGGRDPIEGFVDLGVLHRPLTLVHMNVITEHEVELLTDGRPAVVHCPPRR